MKLNFATRLKELRNEKGLTKTELGRIFHISRTTIYHWECGKQEPSLQMLINLSEYFEVSTDFILGITES